MFNVFNLIFVAEKNPEKITRIIKGMSKDQDPAGINHLEKRIREHKVLFEK